MSPVPGIVDPKSLLNPGKSTPGSISNKSVAKRTMPLGGNTKSPATASPQAPSPSKGLGAPTSAIKTASEILEKLAYVEKTAEIDLNQLWNGASSWLKKNPNAMNALIGGGIGGGLGLMSGGWRGALGGALAGAGLGYGARPMYSWMGRNVVPYFNTPATIGGVPATTGGGATGGVPAPQPRDKFVEDARKRYQTPIVPGRSYGTGIRGAQEQGNVTVENALRQQFKADREAQKKTFDSESMWTHFFR